MGPKLQAAIKALQEIIDGKNPGDDLETAQYLCGAIDASYGTTLKALKHLITKGVLEKRETYHKIDHPGGYRPNVVKSVRYVVK